MWKDVPGYPGIQAHADGRIRVLARTVIGKRGTQTWPTREIKIYTHDRYPVVTIPDLRPEAPRYQRTAMAHKLIALAHCKKEPHHYLVRHKDGNVLNWRASNLVWGTSKDNEKDKLFHGRRPEGVSHPMAKLTDDDVAYIKANYRPKTHGEFNANNLGKRFGVHRTTIENIVSGRTWK